MPLFIRPIFANQKGIAVLLAVAIVAGVAISLSSCMPEPEDDESKLEQDDEMPKKIDFDLRTQPPITVLGVPERNPRESDETWYLERDRRITLQLPENRYATIDTTAVLARHEENSRRLSEIEFFLPHMTLEEATNEARRLGKLIGIEDKKIESTIKEWMSRVNGGEGSIARAVFSRRNAHPYYPAIEIRTTFNDAKPWRLHLSFFWDIPPDVDDVGEKDKTEKAP